VKTKSVLLKSAKWFFNSKINQLVEEQGKFNYTPMIEDMKKEYLGYENNLALVKSLYKNPENIIDFLPEKSVLAWNLYRNLLK
jgi:hypothetical protein